MIDLSQIKHLDAARQWLESNRQGALVEGDYYALCACAGGILVTKPEGAVIPEAILLWADNTATRIAPHAQFKTIPFQEGLQTVRGWMVEQLKAN